MTQNYEAKSNEILENDCNMDNPFLLRTDLWIAFKKADDKIKLNLIQILSGVLCLKFTVKAFRTKERYPLS